jgi:hypothetical protein
VAGQTVGRDEDAREILMSFNPFGAVTDRLQMRSKIALFTLLIALAAVWFLRKQLPPLDHVLKAFSIEVDVIGGLSLPLGTLLPALTVAVLSYAFELHDKLSDLLGIRQRFDVNKILLPMAMEVGVDFSGCRGRLLITNRRSLMRRTFYRYVSGDPTQSTIDTHYVHQALDAWAWYWIFLEGAIIAAITALFLLIEGKLKATFLAAGAGVVFIVLVVLMRPTCARRARDEIDAILDDENRKKYVRRVFCEL